MTYPFEELVVVPQEAAVGVSVECDLVHLCPHADEEDLGSVKVSWMCAGATIELHSLKRYLDAYEEASISHEELTDLIAQDLSRLDGIVEVSVISSWKTAGMAVGVFTP